MLHGKPYKLGKYIRKEVFENNGQTFSAKYQAEVFLSENGYSYGSTDLSPYVPVRKGEYDLPQKMHNITAAGRKTLDGVIFSTDYREGSVTVYLYR